MDHFDRTSPHAPAPSAAVEAYEKIARTTFRDDFRSFLDRWNGLDPDGWKADPRWNTSREFVEEASVLYEEFDEWLGVELDPNGTGMDCFEGIATGDPTLELEGPTEEHFYDMRLKPHGYVIGHTGLGDPYVQITQGKFGGHIIMVDHETYYEGADRIFEPTLFDEKDRALVPFSDFITATTDEVWQALVDLTFVEFVAPDFATLLARRITFERRIMAALAPKYWTGD